MIYLKSDDINIINYWRSVLSEESEILENENINGNIIICDYDYVISHPNFLQNYKNNTLIVLDRVPNFIKADELLKSGIKGYGNIYMNKSYFEVMLDAIKNGYVWIPPDIVSQLLKKEKTPNDFLNVLTPREKEIALLIINGKKYYEIAKDLNITLRTVKAHTQNIYKKLCVKNKFEFFKLFSTKVQ